MFANDQFADQKESELEKAKLMFKKREQLIVFNSIKFNDKVINLVIDEILSLN